MSMPSTYHISEACSLGPSGWTSLEWLMVSKGDFLIYNRSYLQNRSCGYPYWSATKTAHGQNRLNKPPSHYHHMVYIPLFNHRMAINKHSNELKYHLNTQLQTTTDTYTTIKKHKQMMWMELPWLQTASLAWSWSHHKGTRLHHLSQYPLVYTVNSG